MMLCIRSDQLDKIEQAIADRQPVEGESLSEALKVIAEVRSIAASDEQREAAGVGWGPFADEIEIDDEASVSEADEGYWVSAWVWVRKPETDEDDDDDLADQKHNAQMLDGCETEDDLNAELRAQTQGR